MKKRIILILAVAAIAGAAYYALRGRGKDTTGRILVSGNIELNEINVGFKTPGRLIERSVDEGDKVTKGQVVARLDRDHGAGDRGVDRGGELFFRIADLLADLHPVADPDQRFADRPDVL